MVSKARRAIRSGKEFDHLFPPPSEKDKTIKRQADVEDTMALIRRTVPLTLWHTEKIAKKLRGRTLEETCSNIWHFVYNHIQYKRDENGVEQVRSPRRTWWERKSGVDCDCYTEFISSILLNLDIPHKARVTKYPTKVSTPRWQHVYPIVPKPGRWHRDMSDRNDYIVIDCVKDAFDDEQLYLERKDYDMRLDYLDGIEEDEIEGEDMVYVEYDEETMDYAEPDSVDLADLASIYDDEELGNIFKKVSKAVKKTAKKVGSAVKTVAKDIKKTVPVIAKKVSDTVGEGVRFINRYVNPATILLRNGFLLAMKINMKNVAGKLRYAYLTDAQAQAKGIKLSELKKLRAIKDRAETVYWQAGGKKSNLKKAILGGKGNKDKKVALNGFEGVDGLDNVYADYDEYNIIHSDNIEGLGEIASGTALAAATSAVMAIAASLKQIKGLFAQGGSEEQAFQSETENAGSASSAPAVIPEDEDAIANADLPQVVIPNASQSFTSASYSQGSNTQSNYATQANTSPAPSGESVLPDQYTADRRIPATTETATKSTALQTQNSAAEEKGTLQKTTAWVQENPGKSLLVAGGIITGTFLLANALKGGSSTKGLNGIPRKRNTKRRQRKSNRKIKVRTQNLL